MPQDPQEKQSSVWAQLMAQRLSPGNQAPTSVSRQTGPYEMGARQTDAFGRGYPTPTSTAGQGIWPSQSSVPFYEQYQNPPQVPPRHQGHTAGQHEAMRDSVNAPQGQPNPMEALASRMIQDPQQSQNFPELTNPQMAYQSPQLENVQEVYNSNNDVRQGYDPYDTYDRGEALQSMPGAAQIWGDPESVTGMDAGRNWESMPNPGSDPNLLSHLDRPWYDKPEARAIASRMEQQARPSPIGTTEQAYQASLPGMDRIQQNAQTQIAMNEGKLDSPDLQMRNLSPGMQGASASEVDVPEVGPSVSKYDTDVMGRKAQNAAIGAAGKLGDATKATLGFGGSMLNSFLYGGRSDKNLFQNLNKTLYGGKGTLGENVFGPRPKGRGAGGGQGQITDTFTNKDGSTVEEAYNKDRDTWGQVDKGTGNVPSSGFKGAFAQARKDGLKEFSYKGKKYNTMRADKKPLKKKKASSYRNQIKARIRQGNFKNNADYFQSGGNR